MDIDGLGGRMEFIFDYLSDGGGLGLYLLMDFFFGYSFGFLF